MPLPFVSISLNSVHMVGTALLATGSGVRQKPRAMVSGATTKEECYKEWDQELRDDFVGSRPAV